MNTWFQFCQVFDHTITSIVNTGRHGFKKITRHRLLHFHHAVNALLGDIIVITFVIRFIDAVSGLIFLLFIFFSFLLLIFSDLLLIFKVAVLLKSWLVNYGRNLCRQPTLQLSATLFPKFTQTSFSTELMLTNAGLQLYARRRKELVTGNRRCGTIFALQWGENTTKNSKY